MYVCTCVLVLQVLELVTEKTELFTPAKRMYTLDGQLVQAVTAIENRGEYVAVEGTKYVCAYAYVQCMHNLFTLAC